MTADSSLPDSLFPAPLRDLASRLVADAGVRGHMVATAESCTGGLIAGLLTEIPGSSAVVDRGFVTYTNAAKTELLGVPADLIANHGAVSAPVARAMAEGALARSRAQMAVAVTGIAGPGGGSDAKPVGLVWFGLARSGAATETVKHRFGDRGRTAVRLASVQVALEMLLRP
ncbi:damage-inducible protein CinA [Rhodothalassium salexigens]|uniref:CinA family protein n=1 Tax=Rhodothalassium salexigens TaxID=1086 RepID=UPI0019113331|nr:CinA family protein [Rhodothalassium salexigens]MBK5911092.1 damage-inducible protein CinA [Rhodothalassium salexigens]